VPFALDLLDDPNSKLLLTAASAPLALGRPYAAPPGVPAERLAALREGLTATFRDPAFLADCERQRLECSDHHSGAELEKLIREAYATPDEIRKRLVAIQQQGEAQDRK
jgi:tripartite-type tricarboxylate transporter receptor subunit TctC